MSTLKSLLIGLNQTLDLTSLDQLVDEFSSAPITAAALGVLSNLTFIADDVARVVAAGQPAAPKTATPGAPYSTVYAFGDSLSDTGNVSLGTLGFVPVSPPYLNGSFSNGPVWVQDLAADLGLPALKPSLAGGTDFAYGGAETGKTPVHSLNPTDLPAQYAQFLAQDPSPKANALYTIWIGSNDVLDIANNASLTPAQARADVFAAVQNEVAVVGALALHGAQNLLVLNVPDLGKTPYEMQRGAAVAANASMLSMQYDSDLAAALKPVAALPSVKLDLVNTFAVIDQVVADPTAFGFTDVTDPIWNGSLTSSTSGTLRATGAAQNQYLFFDSLHPSAHADALLASGIAQGLTGVA